MSSSRLALCVAFLLALGPLAYAANPDIQQLEEQIKQAFLTGRPVPDVPAGSGLSEVDALRQKVILIQAGTNGSDDDKRLLSAAIDSLSQDKLIGQRPPEDVVKQ